MEWWSIGFLAGALCVMIFAGLGGYIQEKLTKKEPEQKKIKERYSKDDVLLVLWEFRRYACRYEQGVLDQVIDDMERIYDNKRTDSTDD